MSGLELIAVVGVAASASQLIEYSLKIIGMVSEIYSRVKDAPKRIFQYTTWINQLVAACRAIQAYKSLDSPLIDDQLRSTFGELRHLDQALKGIRLDYTAGSKSKRVWKTIVSNREKSIVTCFERLEKEKTALILCINVIHIQTLRNIGSGVDILIERGMPNPLPELFDSLNVGGIDRKAHIPQSTLATDSATTEEEKTVIMPASNSRERRDPVRSDSDCGPLSPSKVHEPQPQEGVQLEGSRPQEKKSKVVKRRKRQTFENMKASQHATQYNGDENDTVNAGHSYSSLIACDNSFQHNGNRDCTGGTGAHRQRNAHATGNSIQRNGNIGGKITDAAIRERAGKEKPEGENSEMMDLDEEFLDEEEYEEESEEELDEDDCD